MKKINHALSLLFIILLTGLLGGIGNYYLFFDPAMATVNNGLFSEKGFLEKSLTLGLIASIIVPFFLSVISSSLLDFNENGPHHKQYFIFAGLCLMAALFSNRFLFKVYESAIGEELAVMKKELMETDRKAGIALSSELMRRESKKDDQPRLEAKDILVLANQHELNSDQILTLGHIATTSPGDSNKLKVKLDSLGVDFSKNFADLKYMGVIENIKSQGIGEQ